MTKCQPWLFILWTFLQLINQALWPLLTPEYPSPPISSQEDSRRINKQVNFTRFHRPANSIIALILRYRKMCIAKYIDEEVRRSYGAESIIFFFLFLLKIKIIKKLNESAWYKNDREILLFYIIQTIFINFYPNCICDNNIKNYIFLFLI